MKLRKIINVITLVVMVSVNVFTPISYADIESGDVADIENPVIEEPVIEMLTENNDMSTSGTALNVGTQVVIEEPVVETPTENNDMSTSGNVLNIENPENLVKLVEPKQSLVPVIELGDNNLMSGLNNDIADEHGTDNFSGGNSDLVVDELVLSNEILDLGELDKGLGKEILAVLTDRVTYGEQEYIGTLEGNSGAMNNFKYKEIIITNGIEKYTIMDRNLGATDRWNTSDNGWSSYNSNIYSDTNTPGSYGYYYQYGNNYGFAAGTTPTISSTPVAVSQRTGKTSTYSGSTWISMNPWNAGASINDTLWGGNSGTQVQRRGPCPEGWHVPSIDEWEGVLDVLNVGDWSEVQTFANVIYLPPAGYHYANTFSNYSTVGSRGYYWVSSLGADNLAYNLAFSGGWRGNWSIDMAGRSDGNSVRCFKNTIDEISGDTPVKITFDTDGGYFSDGSETKIVTYTRDESLNYIPNINLEFPNKEADGNTKYMFDWWYLTGLEERWTGYVSQDITLYAKYLPFEDLVISFEGGEVVIMDRNLGATESGITCSSSSTGACGYQYQWGNNYGFAHNGMSSNTVFINNEEITKRMAQDWEDKVSTYWSNLFRSVSPWNKGATETDNLWGGADYLNPDEDKRGPCPAGYHVPDTKEWNALYQLMNKPYKDKFLNDLLLSPTGWRQASDQKTQSIGSMPGYWASNPAGAGGAMAVITYYGSLKLNHEGGRSDALSVRCFKDYTGTRVIKFETNGGSDVPDSKTGRRWEYEDKLPTPTKANSKFDAWYTTPTFKKGTQVYTRIITGDDTEEPITLYARRTEGVTTLEGNNAGMNNFGYNTITIGDYVIMDRDLGATVVNGNGYRYQWGNNYGFETLRPSSSSSVEIPADKIPSKYSSGVWHTNQPWTTEKNMWGDTSGTDIARQGPCPEGWHVPSKNQWIGIWNAWKTSSDKSDLFQFDSENFAFDLNLVHNGYKISSNSYGSCGSSQVNGVMYPCTAEYWSSSYNSSDHVYYFYASYDGSTSYYRSPSYGLPVRCFKNDPLYKLRLHTNGGVMSEPEEQQIQKGINKNLPTPTTGNSDYVFGGWYMNENFSGNRIYNITLTGDIDLYAKWNPSYLLTYHPNEGYLSTTSEKLVEGTTKTLPTPTTGNEQYTFAGWYLNENFTGNRIYSVVMTGNVDVYAKWNYHENYNVTFHVRNETFEKNVLEGRVLVNLAPTTFPDGYIVGGWYTDSELTNFYDITKPITGNVELYAKQFEYGTITVEDPDNAANSGFIIMDRNLGAFEAGTGVNSYGYHYQWGNNYGFPNTGQVIYTSTRLPWNSEYDNKGFYQTGYYTSSNFWSDNIYHTGVWGGAGDNYNNNRGLDIMNTTSGNRQGPCPEGWHVPSAGEWSKLMEYWKKGYNGGSQIGQSISNGLNYYYFNPSTDVYQFMNDLKMPLAGYRSSYSNTYGQGILSSSYLYYWSSTPYSNYNAYYLYMYGGSNYIYSYSNNGFYYGQSVRCFKNTYNPVTYTVKFETNGGEPLTDLRVVKGNLLKIKGDPIYLGYFFKGWYKDSGLTQPYDMSSPVNENMTLYAKWNNSFGTISISDPDNINSGFTIMDRNLGAMESGIGEDAYGYLYQWGNNHGFSSNANNVNITTELVEWDSGYDNKGYYGTQFVIKYFGPYDYRSGTYMHNGLWGGRGDYTGNNWGLDNISETVENRRGPCPEGYHIPSAGEWSKALEYRAKTYSGENNENLQLNMSNSLYYLGVKSKDFQQYFALPFVGYYYQNSSSDRYWIYHYKGVGYYRTSSPRDGVYGGALYIDNGTIHPDYVYNRYYGESVRCFANNYKTPDVYTLTFESNGGDEIEGREIRENHKLTGLPDIERENSKFEGWYIDNEFTQKYNLNEIIEDNLKFYAKWSCDFGYQLSDDGQACEPISVKFNANGGKFGDEEITKINSNIETIPTYYTKYSHTENIDENGNKMYDYGDRWGNVNIVGTDRGDTSKAHVLTIPGATSLHVYIQYGGENKSYDYLCAWEGSHPTYTPSANESTSIGGSRIGPVDSNQGILTKEFDVNGDTVTFSYVTDGSANGNAGGKGYGYFAIVEGTGNGYYIKYPDNVFENIPEPTRDGYSFEGWYLDNGTFEHEFNKNDVTTGASMNVYAKRKCVSGCEEGKTGGDNYSGGGKRFPVIDIHGSADDKNIIAPQDNKEGNEETSKGENTSLKDDTLVNSSNELTEQQDGQKSQIYTQEQKESYSFAKSNGITTTSTIEQAKMNTSLTRIEMAKMLSNYAINVLGKTPDTSKGTVKFNDVTNKMDKNYDNGVTLSYQLGIMGQNVKNNNFRPNDEVTRAEFVTALSRLLYETPEGTNKGTRKYYEPHMAKLYNEGIISNTNPNMKEKRGYVMLMLMRSAK